MSIDNYTLGEFPIHKSAAPEKKLTVDRFVDVSTLAVGLGAYSMWLAAAEKKPDALLKHGATMARRYRDQLTLGFEKFIAPLMERDDAAKLKIAWRRAMRPGSPDVMFMRRGEFFTVLMPWLRRHQQVMRDLFSGKAYQAALKLSQAVVEEDPGAILNKLAVIAPVSGLRAPRKWNEEAAEAAGAPISDTESLMADAQEAQQKVTSLRDAQTALDNAEPGSQDEADAAAEKAVVTSQIEEIAAESKDPSAVRGAVVSAASEQPTSSIGEKMGLTPEQMGALVANGKIIITAGAGSGKTRVLAAKIAHYVQEKGYRPEQIMATSFTRKSAKELKERVEENFGITEANIGTTHSISAQVIRSFKPQWQNALRAAMDGTTERLFTIAMSQVQLDPGAQSRPSGGYGGRRRYAGRNLYKDALGQWFNLGEKLIDAKGKPIGKKRLKNFIGKWKMGGWGPEQAWAFYKGRQAESTTPYFAAAVYGAYEFLKNEDPEYAPAFDFDDWLIKAVEVLENDPAALETLQRRYKIVLVDEAQDLNAMQHKLFSMIAGQADTYALIGDDKQAIYAFRGAVPEEFIDLPEKGFENKQLTMNFRSGQSIVDAANKLIAHNERQIPMVCDANVERKGMGQIRAMEEDTHEKAASVACAEIADSIKNGGMSPDDFGVIVRNNAEADAYALSLMARGIPFRTKVDFFNKPIIKAALAWMTINSGGSDEEVNDAIVSAHQTPGFFLDKQFGSMLGKRAPRGMNYLDYLLSGGQVYDQAWRDKKMVAAYRDVVSQVVGFEGDTAQVLRFIMGIQGTKQSFQDSLIEQIDVDDLAEDLGREPSEEEIREAALVPIRPVMAVAENFEDPKKMMTFIHKLKRANAQTRKGEEDPEPAVPIMTCHSWKGLEAKHVYVSMAQGVFPPSEELMRRDEAPDPIIKAGTIEDERRLAYVAITRGEDSVTIMCPRETYRGTPGGPSQFVDEACIGMVGAETPKPDNEVAEDSPPPGRTASVPKHLNFATILEGFFHGASSCDFKDDGDDSPEPESELETEWEYLP